MKNEAVVQRQAVSLRNLENKIGWLATSLSNIPQGHLPSSTKGLRREGKEYCKVINLKSKKDVHIHVGAPKRRVELVLTQQETQIEKEPQQSTF